MPTSGGPHNQGEQNNAQQFRTDCEQPNPADRGPDSRHEHPVKGLGPNERPHSRAWFPASLD